MPDRLTIATIDLQNYRHNLAEIHTLLPSTTHIMAVVKANAYGHGIAKMAETAIAAGATYLGVVSLGELKKIRHAGITAPVLVLNYLDSSSMAEAVSLDATITIMDNEAAASLENAAATQAKTAKVHLKIDTGMHRAGCDPDHVVELATSIVATPHLELEGIFTHFAESEDVDPAFTETQLAVFNRCISTLQTSGIAPPLIHCANSAAILAFPQSHFTMVRPGLLSYGLNPFPEEHPQYSFVQEHFKPVLSLTTQVAFIRTIQTGQSVGYNRRWTAQRSSRVALLPVGYGDGYRRTPQNAGKVLIAGQYAPIVGSVAMDQTVIDITDIKDEVRVGNEVVLLGQQGTAIISADDIATAYGTINYEVVTALSDRVEREYIEL